jgi:hypothetical protein
MSTTNGRALEIVDRRVNATGVAAAAEKRRLENAAEENIEMKRRLTLVSWLNNCASQIVKARSSADVYTLLRTIEVEAAKHADLPGHVYQPVLTALLDAQKDVNEATSNQRVCSILTKVGKIACDYDDDSGSECVDLLKVSGCQDEDTAEVCIKKLKEFIARHTKIAEWHGSWCKDVKRDKSPYANHDFPHGVKIGDIGIEYLVGANRAMNCRFELFWDLPAQISDIKPTIADLENAIKEIARRMGKSEVEIKQETVNCQLSVVADGTTLRDLSLSNTHKRIVASLDEGRSHYAKIGADLVDEEGNSTVLQTTARCIVGGHQIYNTTVTTGNEIIFKGVKFSANATAANLKRHMGFREFRFAIELDPKCVIGGDAIAALSPEFTVQARVAHIS